MKNIFIQKFNSLEYESQVLALICGFGVLRMILELIMDVVAKSRIHEVTINIAIFLIIISLLFTSLNKNFKNIHIVFGILLTLALSILILVFGGIQGYAKFNYFSSLYFIVMVYANYKLIALLAINFVTITSVLIIGILSPPWLESVNFGSSYQRFDFWFTLIMLSAFTIYLKEITIAQGGKLSALNLQMSGQVKESRKLGVMLKVTNLELKQTQIYLEEEVDKRTESLLKKNKSVESFIQLNTTELIEAVDDLLTSMQQLNTPSQYADKLSASGKKLATVVEKIRYSLKESGTIDRKALSNHERHI